jgi:hypothetical protein
MQINVYFINVLIQSIVHENHESHEKKRDVDDVGLVSLLATHLNGATWL